MPAPNPRRRRYDVQGELYDYLNVDMDPYDFGDNLPEWAEIVGLELDDEPQVENLTPAQLKSFKAWLVANESTIISAMPPSLVPSYIYLREPRKLPKGSWLLHFTNASPFKAFDRGATIWDGLHLTVGAGKHKVESPKKNLSEDVGPYERVYGFAFNLAREGTGRGGSVDLVRYASRKYGTNMVLFQCDQAVEAYHAGDEEHQAIFPIGSEYNAVPLVYSRDDDSIWGQTQVAEQVQFNSIAEVLDYIRSEQAILANPSRSSGPILVRIR